MWSLNIPYVEVAIDFIDAPYEVNETDGVANVTVGVVRGQLMREVVVELSFSDGTAIGKQCLIRAFCSLQSSKSVQVFHYINPC